MGNKAGEWRKQAENKGLNGTHTSSTTSIIILNIIGENTLIKIQILAEWMKKNINYMYLQETQFKLNNAGGLKVKMMVQTRTTREIYHDDIIQKDKKLQKWKYEM